MFLNKNETGFQWFKKIFLSVSGMLLYVMGLDLFLINNNIAAGGISGVALILTNYTSLSFGTLVMLMNIPILIAAVIINGWKFTSGTIILTVLYSSSVDWFSFLPTLSDDPIVAALAGGVLYGAGMALITIGNSSTGGTDLLTRLMVKIFPSLSIGKMCIIIDGIVVISAMIVFKNVEIGLYALITLYVTSTTCDRIIMGFDRGCMCTIFTTKDAHEIADPLIKITGRTVTKLMGTGMFTNKECNVLLMAVRQNEVARIKNELIRLDPKSFVVMLPVNELIGGRSEIRLQP